MTKALADKLQIWGIEEGITIFTDGSLGFGLELNSLDISCWNDDAIESLDSRIKSFLNGLPSNLDIQFVQDITGGNEAILSKYEKASTENNSLLVQELGKIRTEKFRELDQSGDLPKYTFRLFVRKKLDSPLIQRPKLLDREKLFPEIAEKQLSLEINKINRVKDDVIASLQTISLSAHLIPEERLIKLIQDQWNPSRNMPLGIYDPYYVRPYLAFTDVAINRGGFSIGETYFKLISLKLLPGQTYSSMAHVLKELPFNSRLYVSVHIPDQQKEIEALQLQRRLAFSMVHGKQSGVSDLESEAKLNDLEFLLSEMISQGEKIFHFSLNVLLQSKSSEDLEDQVSRTLLKIRELGGAEGMEETLASFDLFCDLSLPNSKMKERVRRIKTSNLAHLIPIYAPWGGHDEPKTILRSRMGTLFSFDPFSPTLTNANQIISGGSGSGKSFLANLLLIQMLKENPKIFIVDIGGSYKKICENLEGQYISLGLNSGITINPFDLPSNERRPSNDKIKFILALIETMTKEDNEKGLKKLERSEIETAIEKVYQNKSNPKLSDLREVLICHENTELRRVGKILNSWCGTSPFGSFIDQKSSISLNKSLICFDLKELEAHPELQAVCLLMITDLVWREVQKDKTNMKFLIFDECWKLLENESGAKFIAEVFRTFRKSYASCIALSQNIDDFAKSKVSSAIMPNSSIRWILKQKGADKKRLKEVLDLNDSEIDLISSLHQERGVYSEAFLICENNKAVASIESTSLEYWLATTDPRDTSLLEKKIREFPEKTSLAILKELANEYPYGVAHSL